MLLLFSYRKTLSHVVLFPNGIEKPFTQKVSVFFSLVNISAFCRFFFFFCLRLIFLFGIKKCSCCFNDTVRLCFYFFTFCNFFLSFSCSSFLLLFFFLFMYFLSCKDVIFLLVLTIIILLLKKLCALFTITYININISSLHLYAYTNLYMYIYKD